MAPKVETKWSRPNVEKLTAKFDALAVALAEHARGMVDRANRLIAMRKASRNGYVEKWRKQMMQEQDGESGNMD